MNYWPSITQSRQIESLVISDRSVDTPRHSSLPYAGANQANPLYQEHRKGSKVHAIDDVIVFRDPRMLTWPVEHVAQEHRNQLASPRA